MKVLVGDKSYFVTFEHIQKMEESEHKGTVSIVLPGTHCYIYDGPSGEGELVADGRSVCHAHDHFNKNIGRKYSLSRALHELFPKPEDKPARAAFWAAYREMRNGRI